MAKFYVESGDQQLVLHANNARGAALWAVHRAMSQVLPFLRDELADERDPQPQPPRQSLGDSVTVSQRGFARADARRFDTFELVTEWNQLIVALDRLESEFMQPA